MGTAGRQAQLRRRAQRAGPAADRAVSRWLPSTFLRPYRQIALPSVLSVDPRSCDSRQLVDELTFGREILDNFEPRAVLQRSLFKPITFLITSPLHPLVRQLIRGTNRVQ